MTNQEASQYLRRHLYLSVTVVAATLLLAGCGGGDFEVAPTTGVVRCNGRPIEGGLVFFEPTRTGDSAIVGKVGLGVIDEQGQFSVSTYGDSDGAVVGPHVIKVGRGDSAGCDCAMNADRAVMEVQISRGADNYFEVDLPGKT